MQYFKNKIDDKRERENLRTAHLNYLGCNQ